MTKNNKVTLNQKFDRKLEGSSFNFSKNFKFFFIISFVFLLVGIMIFSFFGFNLGYDFVELNTFKIYTNSENYITVEGVSSFDLNDNQQYNKAVEKIENILNANNLSIANIDKTTIDILDENIKSAQALQITFYNDLSLTEEELKTFNENLKVQLLEEFGYSQSSVINIEDAVSNIEPLNYYNQSSETIYSAIIAMVISIVFVLIYLSLRYEKSAFVTGFVTIAHDILLTLSILAFTRIPLSLSCIGTIAFVFILSVLNLIIYYAKSKELTSSGAVDKFKSSIVANEVSKQNVKFNLYLYLTLIIASIIFIAISTMQIRIFAITIFIATIVCWFSAQFILNGFYRMVYKPVKKNRKFI